MSNQEKIWKGPPSAPLSDLDYIDRHYNDFWSSPEIGLKEWKAMKN